MTLVDRLDRLNERADEILAVLRENIAAEQPAPMPRGERSDLMPAGSFFFVAGMRAMRASLVDLPETYYERTDDGVRVACRCRRAWDVPLYSFHECNCGRVFCITHRSVKVLPLEAQAVAA